MPRHHLQFVSPPVWWEIVAGMAQAEPLATRVALDR
jgi:hypothetical protein